MLDHTYVQREFSVLEGTFDRHECFWVRGQIKNIIRNPTSAPIRSIWYSAIPYADGTWSIDEENLRDELDGEGFRPIILISDEHDGKALFVPVTRTGRTVSISHPVPDESPLVGFADCMDIWGRPMPHEPAETYIMPLDFVQEVVRKMLLRFNLQ